MKCQTLERETAIANLQAEVVRRADGPRRPQNAGGGRNRQGRRNAGGCAPKARPPRSARTVKAKRRRFAVGAAKAEAYRQGDAVGTRLHGDATAASTT